MYPPLFYLCNGLPLILCIIYPQMIYVKIYYCKI
uniref:Uncharacterized protein n=1 Tax=Siphoviridae sp. ctCIv11 TaxID=2827806 RepID=A0A8S5S2Q5_9CAUD|nr:MAG TPA: hypothetical protein [Siphoviridae sp. ctCIv11]